MMLFEFFVIGILGLIIGSFLNVYILRLHTGRSTAGRSGCMSCGAKLSWSELIPVVSFFSLGGRCKACGSTISHQYWIVELTTAAMFVLVWAQGYMLLPAVFAMVLMAMLIVIAVYDLKHTIIPNKVVYAFIVLAFLTNIPILGTTGFLDMAGTLIVAVVSGALVATPLFLLWLVSKGAWMGFGDVKLSLGFGLVLGIYEGLTAIMLGFILGAVIGLVLLYGPRLMKKVMKDSSLSYAASRFTMSSEVPFAPFLILGFILVFLFDVDVLQIVGSFIYDY